jgi:hypothetical protein
VADKTAMYSNTFLEKLLVRLKSGDARSIHLNALPGNFARLDVYDLATIEQSLHLSFLQQLLTKKSFRFSITVEPEAWKDKNEDHQKIIQRIIRRLNHLEYQDKEEFSEHGYSTFGFGYPLLIKRDPNHPERIIKAPLLIWYLSIDKDTRKNNTWIISRNEEHPLIFNELLQSHFEQQEQIKTDDLEALLEDDFLEEKQLNVFCKRLLEKMHIPFDADENIVTLLPGSNKEAIENCTKEKPWIRWSAIFGLYKMQKQPIIRDVENLLRKQSSIRNEETSNLQTANYFDGEVLTPIALDSSQENVLNQLSNRHNLIIQGPPGTGKSQTLTAIITQALLNKQKVLVVCEKRTAMEVLYNNLKSKNLEHLCAIIEDVYTDRKKMVEQVRAIIESNAPAVRFRSHDYEMLHGQFLSLKEEINFRINLTQTTVFGDDTWLELLCNSSILNSNPEVAAKADSLNKLLRSSDYQFSFEEYLSLKDKIIAAHHLYSTVHADAVIFEQLHSNLSDSAVDETQLFDSLTALFQLSGNLENTLQANLNTYQDDFNLLTGITHFKIAVLSVFLSSYRQIKEEKKSCLSVYTHIKLYSEVYPSFGVNFISTDNLEKMEILLPPLQHVRIQTEKLLQKQHLFSDYYQYRKYILQQDSNTQNILNAIATTGDTDWETIFTTYYLNQFILKTAMENNLKDDTQQLYNELGQKDVSLKQPICDKINHIWQENIHQLLQNADITELKYLYNQRKNKQFATRNSLRKIVHHDTDFFTTLFPVLMVNPSVCTSILPFQEDLFDFIILDEASQLRIEDTFSSLLRGKIKIISGDKHQMPPSNFFGSETIFWQEEESAQETESFLAESKSLLEYADDANYKNSYLDFHYRSLHPDLIQFSNHAFYQSRLIPMPEKEHYPALIYKNTEGTYTQGTNTKEASDIVTFIYQLQKTNGAYPSVGIATFNIFQRDLILDQLYEQAYAETQKNELLRELLDKGLFVKNLENIQGDERDIMLLSTTFGKDENGKFRQLFGPLSQEKGYQLLNVIITRAKHSLYVFTSIPETVFMNFEMELKQKGNQGKSIFYAYLAFVKAKHEHNEQQVQFILNQLQQNNTPLFNNKPTDTATPFKNRVYAALKEYFGEDVQQDYTFGGFTLDIILYKNKLPFLHIDFEKTGHYHPEVSYRTKLHRQKILAEYGILTYHLWSYHWWKNPASELEKIGRILS